MYYRFGHMQNVLVKTGDYVKKGQQLGTIGTGNGQFSAHLHLDLPIKKLSSWTNYVFGMTKEQVRAAYADSTSIEKIVLPKFDHYGYKYLDYATYGTRHCYHPGGDLNGLGAGNADLGLPFYSPIDGKVIYDYSGVGTNGGWGKLLVLEPATLEECKHCLIHCPK